MSPLDSIDHLRQGLADRYDMERVIGRGGMATVYLARDLRHHRPVALKVLDPELAAVLGAERFLGEIKVTANLQHPNLLPLFDSGEVGGLLFYVMPYVEGESLRARLDREKQLPIDEAVRIATPAAGGAPTKILDMPDRFFGASWGPGDVIVLGGSAKKPGLSRVSASGGDLKPLSKVDTVTERNHYWPVVLDDGETVVFTSWRGSVEQSRLAVTSLTTGETHSLGIDGVFAFGVSAGMLYYARSDGAVLAIAFDRRRGTTSGNPELIANGLRIGSTAEAKAAMSSAGTLVYEKGRLDPRLITSGPRGEDQRPFAVSGLVFSGAGGVTPRFSPDGRKLALTVGPPQLRSVWVIDLASGTRLNMTPSDSKDHSSLSWSSDGKSLLYRVLPRNGAARSSFWSQSADGSGHPILVLPASIPGGQTHGRALDAGRTRRGVHPQKRQDAERHLVSSTSR